MKLPRWPPDEIPSGMTAYINDDNEIVYEPRERGQVRIISKGTGVETTVTVDGRELVDVKSVTWTLNGADMIATATIIVHNVAVDIIA